MRFKQAKTGRKQMFCTPQAMTGDTGYMIMRKVRYGGSLQCYRTTSSSNLVSDSFPVSGGSFGITLPAMSVTTLVSG